MRIFKYTTNVNSPGEVPAGSTRSVNIPLPGVQEGDYVGITPDSSIKDSITLDVQVVSSVANVVQVRFTNASSGSDIDTGSLLCAFLVVGDD